MRDKTMIIKKLLGGMSLAAMMMTTSPALANEDLKAAIDQDYVYIENLYKWLHANAELSFQEVKTSKRLADEMEKIGLEVTRNIGGFGTVGLLQNGDGPTVLIRADIDALPLEEKTGVDYASTMIGKGEKGEDVPVMHACGHDVHATSLIATARRLVDMKDQWSGTVLFVAQPAEERVGGARAMLEDGLFEKFPVPNYNLALHVNYGVAGTVDFTPGYALTNVDTVDIFVPGIGGHGSAPQTTKDPIVIASQIVMALQTIVSREVSPQDAAVVTVGAFNSGFKHNIISDGAELKLTVRTFKDSVRDHILASIKRMSENMGRVAGLPEDMLPRVTVRMDEYSPSTYNDPDLTERVMEAVSKALGDDATYLKPPIMAAEDFSRFARTEHKIPSLIFGIGGYDQATIDGYAARGEKLPGNHSPYYAPDPEVTLRTGAHAMTAAVLDLLDKK